MPSIRRRARSASRATAAFLALGMLGACTRPRSESAPPPTYQGEVAALLNAKCASCHDGPTPAGGYRVTSYLGAIGCTAAGTAVVGAGPSSPILTVLERPDHAALLSEGERATLTAWVTSGNLAYRNGVHDPAFADPRAPGSHGRFLRSRRWAPMLDLGRDDACGRCHLGTPAQRDGSVSAAPGATACTTCHAEPEGALACGTCHGTGAKAYPPRDRCFFPEDAPIATHARHAEPSAARAEGLPCSTCHPQPTLGSFVETHGDGYVEVWFDRKLAGNGSAFDASSKRCSGTCHAGPGGAKPTPAWSEGFDAQCGDCHGAPPPSHAPGPCSHCHREATDDGSGLVAATLHVNGRVDRGDGSGGCGACHGEGDSPWPKTGAHASHRAPSAAVPVACDTCHPVPSSGEAHPSRAGAPVVRFAGLALRGGARPTFAAATAACADTYCHTRSGASEATPTWVTATAAATCTSCHGLPPPPPHSQSLACGTSTCHEGSTTAAAGGATMLTSAGAAAHVDGTITRKVP